jgi:hypothetical protein
MKSAVHGLLCGVGIGLAVAAAAAQSQRSSLSLVPPDPTIRLVESRLRNRGAGNRIAGAVIDSRRRPIAGGRLQLRSLLNGRIAQEARTSDRGEFAFPMVEPGTFVVEFTVYGAVLGVSDAVTLSDGEAADVVIQLGGRWDADRQLLEPDSSMLQYVGASAADTMTGSTMTNAANQGIRPVDAGEPVSGQ